MTNQSEAYSTNIELLEWIWQITGTTPGRPDNNKCDFVNNILFL